jgi:hypothetical protein
VADLVQRLRHAVADVPHYVRVGHDRVQLVQIVPGELAEDQAVGFDDNHSSALCVLHTVEAMALRDQSS